MDPFTFALGISLHLGFENEYNSIHPHIRYNHEQFIAGAYYNSEHNLSTYIGKRWEHNDFGLEAGAVTGYNNPIIPYVRGTYKDFFVAPAVENKDTVGLVLGYEVKY
jgi:hypothetical protein